jgi:hypothetical protein
MAQKYTNGPHDWAARTVRSTLLRP